MADMVIGSLWYLLGLDATGLNEEMAKTKASLTKWRDETNKNTLEMGKWAAAIGAAAAPYVAVAKAANDAAQAAGRYGDHIHDLSIQTLLTEREVQLLRYAVDASGGNFDEAAASISFLARNLQNARDPTSRQAKALQELGVNALDARGNVQDMNVLLPVIIDRLHNMQNRTQAANLTMELFGRNTGEVAKMVELGSAGLKSYGDQAAKLGLIMSPEELAVQKEFNNNWAQMSVQLNQMYIELGTQIIPIIQELIPVLEGILPAAEAVIDTVGVLTNGFISLAEAAMAAQAAVAGALTGDFSGATAHLDKSLAAASRAGESGKDLAMIDTSGTGGGTSTSTGGGKLAKGTALSKSKALYNQRNGGVTQVVQISATQQTPAQISTVIKAASIGLATSLRLGGGG
jgi:hypothetical protein